MVASKSNGSSNTTWRCGSCNVKNGAKYKYCWKCWAARPTAAAAGSSSAAAGEASEDKCHDEKLRKVQHYRAKLAELRKLTEDPFLEESLQPQVAQLKDKLAAEQEQRDALEEKLAEEKSKLGKFDSKLETLDNKIKELSVPAPGKGWAAALAFLEQAERCLGDDGSEKREQLVAAVAHAKEQKAQEEERAKQHAERLQQKARRAAKERAGSADNRKRSCPESPIKEELLEIPAGASEQDICKALVDVGVTPDQGRLAVYTVNANMVSSLEPVRKQIRDSYQDAIVPGQELQASGTQIDLPRTRMRREGWDIGLVSSAKTTAGHSAGVLRATPRSRGMDFVRKGINQWDISPRESKGRLAVAWVDAHSKEGLMLGAAYMWNSRGPTQRNQRILAKWGAATNVIQKERILDGDGKMDPEVLEQSEIVRKMNGVIVRDTQQDSCLKQDGTTSARDYFRVSRGLAAHTLKVEVQDGDNMSPHLPVRTRVPVHQQSDYMRNVLCKRTPRPLTRPRGCPSQPVRWPRPLAHRKYTKSQIDGHWSELGEACEKHLSRYHSFEGDDWSKRQGHFEQANCKQKPCRLMPCTAAQEQPLIHDIVMPLFAERAPGQKVEASYDTDEEDGLLESEDAPREEAEGVQDRFAARAPPTEGQQSPKIWNAIHWPFIVHTLRDGRVTDIDECAQNYLGLIATLLDPASRRYWKMVHRAAAAQGRQWVTTHGERGAEGAEGKAITMASTTARQVRGPAGTIIATVQRQCISTATENGLMGDWLRIHGKKHGLDSVAAEPIAALLKRPLNKTWTREYQTRARNLRCDGTWPQRRVLDKGAAEDSIGKACHAHAVTDRHRTYVCSARQDHRRRVGGHHRCQRGAMTRPGATEKQYATSEALWVRGLAAESSLEYDLWSLPSSSTCEVGGAFDGLVHGVIYTDGWAVVKLDGEIMMEFELFGTLEGSQHHQSYKSELAAVLQAVPPVQVYSDRQTHDQTTYKSELATVLQAVPPVQVYSDRQTAIDGVARVVKIDGERMMVFESFGTLEGSQHDQTIYKSELATVLQAVPPVQVYSDRQTAIDGVARVAKIDGERMMDFESFGTLEGSQHDQTIYKSELATVLQAVPPVQVYSDRQTAIDGVARVVKIDGERMMVFESFGTLEGSQHDQTIYKSELAAVLQAVPPVQVYSRRQTAIDGVARVVKIDGERMMVFQAHDQTIYKSELATVLQAVPPVQVYSDRQTAIDGDARVVKIDGERMMDFESFGTLEGSQHDQTIYKSELATVLQAVPPVQVYSDRQTAIDGVARGPERAARADTTHKEVGQECRLLVQENGGTGEQGISLCRVRAHATRAQRAMIGPQQLIGNTIADLDAKRGAQSHQHEAYRATYG
ncbi:unnamed protein product [Prorocentrum cordatum]|uniref:RanBP2-type domain-containing protein n=1 Tax=Prorocentrum cordatum TaxID=2364126 RepID=A0ABN9VSR7_9DINO|nr:unnamed protein product [Polarella glacialis]